MYWKVENETMSDQIFASADIRYTSVISATLSFGSKIKAEVEFTISFWNFCCPNWKLEVGVPIFFFRTFTSNSNLKAKIIFPPLKFCFGTCTPKRKSKRELLLLLKNKVDLSLSTQIYIHRDSQMDTFRDQTEVLKDFGSIGHNNKGSAMCCIMYTL